MIISAYHAIGSEFDPKFLLEVLAEKGVHLALPVLLDKETMVFRAWDRAKPLVPVGFGTLGPDADQPEVLPDLVLAPLAAFSAAGSASAMAKVTMIAPVQDAWGWALSSLCRAGV
jgi:5-formyltetrahydrofolate cyclo-ligase